MSVETGGSMSGATAGAVGTMSAPSAISSAGESFSSGSSFATNEGFSSMSPITSSFDTGGSFMPGLSMEGMLSETVPFSDFSAPVPEAMFKGSADIFSNSSEWQTISTPSVKSQAKTGIFSSADFKPFVVDTAGAVREGPAPSISESDLKTIAKNNSVDVKPITEAEWVDFEKTFFKDFAKPTAQEAARVEDLKIDAVLDAFKEKSFNAKDFKTASEIQINNSTNNINQLREMVEIFSADNLDLKSADRLVGKIETEKTLSAVDKLEQEDLTTIRMMIKQLEVQEMEDEEDEEEVLKSDEKKSVSMKKRLLTFAVDNPTQDNRKSTLKQMVGDLFTLARLRNANKVSGRDAMAQVKEKTEYRSQLLYQSGLAGVPDGSFHEVVEEVGELKSADTSFGSEMAMELAVGSIVDAKPAVMLVEEGALGSVSEKDVKRVTKFAKSSVTPAL